MKNLKLASFLILSIFAMTFISCDNEPLDGDFSALNPDNNENLAQDIIGDWEVISFSANTTSETVFNGVETITGTSIVGSDFDYIVSFSSNQFTTNGNYKMRAITEVNGEVLDDATADYTDVSGSGNYSTNGNVMTLDGSFFDLTVDGMDTSVFGASQSATFYLSADGQTLTVNQDEEQIQNQAGVEIEIIVTSTTVLERI